MRKLTMAFLVAALALNGAGCATRTTTVTKTIERPAESDQDPRVVEQETTVTRESEPRGIISTAFHVVGEILALPFRIVGGLLQILF